MAFFYVLHHRLLAFDREALSREHLAPLDFSDSAPSRKFDYHMVYGDDCSECIEAGSSEYHIISRRHSDDKECQVLSSLSWLHLNGHWESSFYCHGVS